MFQRSTCKQKMFLPDTHIPAEIRHTHILCNTDQKHANWVLNVQHKAMIACWFTYGGVNEIVVSTGVLDPNLPNVQVTRMTLMCDTAPSALVLDLTGECGCSPPFWRKTPTLADSSDSEQQQRPYFYVQTQQTALCVCKLGLTL